MRLLMTGVTKQQCGGGTALGYEPVADLFANGLRHAGFEVDHRFTTIGEDLSGYDAIMVGMVPFFSIASGNLFPALDVIGRAEAQGIPLALFIDDWGFTRLISNMNTHLKNHEQLTKPFFKGRTGHQWAVENRDWLMGIIARLRNQDWPPTVVPAFSWGDHQVIRDLLHVASDLEFADVSALAREYPVKLTPYETRTRSWVLGTVSNQTTWLQKMSLTWDVHHIGTKTARAPEKMQEADLIQLYAKSWGVLSPPYKAILGTGWWRNRAVYAARTRTILLSDQREMPQLGEAYQLRPGKVEGMRLHELRELAEEQGKAFFAAQPPVSEVADQLVNVLVRARERVA